MDNYLKGRKTLESSSEQLEKLKHIANVKSGFPIPEGHKMEVCGKEGEPRVECITEEGRITRILITCTCGEQIELHCKYT